MVGPAAGATLAGCCCGVNCVGCCFGSEPGGPMPDINWEISAPNCPDLDGQTGQFQPNQPQADANPDGNCGKCACYDTNTNEPVVQGTFQTDAAGSCQDSPCSIDVCLGLACEAGEQALEGLPTCCSRVRLLFGISGSSDQDPSISANLSDLDCNPALAACNTFYMIDPTSCTCADCGMEAIFDISGLGMACPSVSLGSSSCDPCCGPNNCDLTGATVSISSAGCSSSSSAA